MGFLDTIFGSSDKAKTKQASTLSPEQQNVSNGLSQFFQNSGSPGNTPRFDGKLTAPLSSLENFSLAALEDRSKQLATQNDPLLESASQALMEILGRGETDVNDFFNTNIKDPLLESFEEDVRPQVGARFADQFFGSARRDADRNSEEELIQQLVRGRSDVALKGREFDTNARLEAAGLAPQVGTTRTNELLALLEAGGLPRSVQQGGLDREFNKFQDFENRKAGRTLDATRFLSIPQVENITTVKKGRKGILGSAAGAAASGFGGVAGKAFATALF